MNRNGEFSNDWRGRDESNWWRKNRGGVHQGQSEESNGRWGRTRTDSYNNDRWPAGRPTSRYDEDEGWDRGESRWSNNSSTHDRRKLDWGETLPEWYFIYYFILLNNLYITYIHLKKLGLLIILVKKAEVLIHLVLFMIIIIMMMITTII